MADWNIPKPLGVCSGTGEAIAPGQEYFAALVEGPEGLERRDFCAGYWQRQRPEVYCFWRARLPQPSEKRQVFVSDAMLMSFFDRLAEDNDPERVRFRFVLALVLMRKRKLKYEDSEVRDGQESWRLRVTGESRFVDVLNPRLTDEQIEQLTEQIGEILNSDLED